jgi:hypothetical protein
VLDCVFNVLRTHSETDCFLGLAFDSIARNSSGVARTRKVPTPRLGDLREPET